ncbi:HD domain-containing protein [Psychromarinibacter sp. S121]|uniref:HD domain-containing protein n=1 Tax=Psychromarinibacter sp. S121 TaxID=3415127 RepID=UPI003C7D0461
MQVLAEDVRLDPVWRRAEPYMRARKNDVHIPLSFHWCRRLLAKHPEADAEICLLAILLHDIGWFAIDMDEIVAQGFRSENFLTSDVRYRHEAEGVRLAREVLADCGYGDNVIGAVCEIIDGHDTRPEPHHLNDRIVRDADKLWRYEVAGIAVAVDWFGITPSAYADQIEGELARFETEAGRAMAEAELAVTRDRLMLHVI